MNDKQIKTIVEDFIDLSGDDVEITTGNLFNLPETTNKISLYKASKFKSGEVDSLGFRKYFYNIVNQSIINSKKNLDLDTKDILIKAKRPEYRTNSLIYNEKFRQYVKETGLGTRINKMIETLCTYGSCITKQTKDGFKIVDMNKIMIDPGVSNKDNCYDLQGGYAIEKLTMNYSELDEMKGKWDREAIDQVLTSFVKINKGDTNKTEIPLYEAYMYVNGELFDDEGYNYYKVVLTLDNEKSEFNNDLNDTEAEVVGRILYTEKIKKLPFKKIDYYTIEGRNLGLGPVETLFDHQQRINEIKHDVKLSMMISSRHLFQSPDDLIERNLLRDLRNGDILKSKSGISPVANEERNLPAWNLELDTWSNNGRLNTNTLEVMTGEALPSSQTLGGQQISTVQAAKFFDVLREEIGMFLKENLIDYVLPIFERNISMEEVIELTSPEAIGEIVIRDINRKINRKVVDLLLEGKPVPTLQEVQIMKQRQLEKIGKEQFTKAKKDFFKFDKKIDIIVTGEGKNLAQEINSISQILNLAANPVIMQDPRMSKLFDMLLEDVGIDKGLFGNETIQRVPTPQQQGQQVKAEVEGEQVAGGPEDITPKT